MKKLVRVTIEKEIEIDIDDSCLTEEALKEFESYMFSLDSYGGCSKIDELFGYVAREVFDNSDTFVDGVGQSCEEYAKSRHKNVKVIYDITDIDSSAEVV